MKKLLLSLLLIPFVKTGPTSSIEIRSGKWPISLESDGRAYSLIFRNQEDLRSESYDTVEFANKGQLVYLDSALMTLKRAHNGDQADFSNYSVKRAENKVTGLWYILKTKYATTNFRQPEADVLSKAIRSF